MIAAADFTPGERVAVHVRGKGKWVWRRGTVAALSPNGERLVLTVRVPRWAVIGQREIPEHDATVVVEIRTIAKAVRL